MSQVPNVKCNPFPVYKRKKMKAQIDVIDNMIVFTTPLSKKCASRVFQKKKII